MFGFFAVATVSVSLLTIGHAQDTQAPKTVHAPDTTAAPDDSVSLLPLADPATPDQIREYLRLSGELVSFRARWIAAVDKNRSIGAPYWPEAFWTDLKAEMQKTDLMPMYIILYQHEISRELMQRVLDAYKLYGRAINYPPHCPTRRTSGNAAHATTRAGLTSQYTHRTTQPQPQHIRYASGRRYRAENILPARTAIQ